MTYKLLLACDLDKTVLPNGKESLSPGAFEQFSEFVSRPDICLAYISGRSINHALVSIKDFNMPLPNFYVGDVGTTMYKKNSSGEYIENLDWRSEFLADWNNVRPDQIEVLLENISGLEPQEAEQQNTYKKSYYFEVEQKTKIVELVKERVITLGINFEVLTLLEEERGYLDIVPKSATKEFALKYLQKLVGVKKDQVVYAGDAGNDLLPLTSGYKAIVVNNAKQAFKAEVKQLAMERKSLGKIYFAAGNYNHFNGNYLSGILEGLQHFKYL